LDEAMSILRVLRSSLKHQPTAIQWTSDFDYLKPESGVKMTGFRIGGASPCVASPICC
jgi:hypothetical protein